MELACDSDRLWSFTHENFWLDTIRKQIQPDDYINIITNEIPTYFFTDPGRARGRELAAKRREEVDAYLAANIQSASAAMRYNDNHAHPRLAKLGHNLYLSKLLDKTRRAYTAYHDNG